MTFYEVPSDERDIRLAKKEIQINRSLIKTSPNFSSQASDQVFGNNAQAMGVNLGNFVMNPTVHYECIEIEWENGTGTIPLKIGDVITTNVGINKWQGRLVYMLTDPLGDISTSGVGVFEPIWLTEPSGFAGLYVGGTAREAFTDVVQTLSTTQDGGDWTADYKLTTLNTGGFVTQSASMICDKMEGQVLGVGGGDPTLDTLYDAKNTGQVITMKPIQGKTLNVNTGGNLNLTANTTVADTDVAIAQYFENSDIDPTGNKWNFSSTAGGSGGGTSSGLLLEPVRVATTAENFAHPIYGDVIDGWTVVEGDRFLVKDQTTLADNGVYVVGAVVATVFTATRAPDFDTDAEVLSGSMVYVKGGNTQADSLMGLESEDPLTVGISDQVWKQVNSNWVNHHDAMGYHITNVGQFESDSTFVADIGTFRLAFDEFYAWRDVTNSWNATYRFNASNEWEWETNGVPVLTIQQGVTDFEQQALFRVGDINAYTGNHDIGNTDPFHRIIGRRFQPSHQVYTTGSLIGELRSNFNDNTIYIDLDDAVGTSFDIRENGRGITGSLADSSDPFYRFDIISNAPLMQLFDDGINDPKIYVGSGITRGEISFYRAGQDFAFLHNDASPTQGIIFNTPFTKFGVYSDNIQADADLFMNSNDVNDVDRLTFTLDSGVVNGVGTPQIYISSAGNAFVTNNDLSSFIWTHNNLMSLIETSNVLEKRDQVAPNFNLNNTRAFQTGTAGNFGFYANTQSAGNVAMAFIIGNTETATGNGTGSMQLGVLHTNSIPTNYIYLNQNDSGNIEFFQDLDMSQKDILDVNEIRADGIRFVNAQPLVGGAPNITSETGNSVDLSFVTGSNFVINENSVPKHTFSSTSLTTPNVVIQQFLTLSANVNPVSNGMMSLVGTDIMAYSGGALRNLSDIGGGGGSSGAVGTQEYHLWTTGDTDQFPNNFVYHSNSHNTGEGANTSLQEDFLFYIPIYIADPSVTLFRVAVRVGVSGGVPYQMGFSLNSNRTDGQNYPASKLAGNSGFFSGAGIKSVIISHSFTEAGLYWIGINCITNSSQQIYWYTNAELTAVGYEEDGSDFVPITGYWTGNASTTHPNTPVDGLLSIRKSFSSTPAVYVRFT